jgi:alcohol dehydrogenase class IV
LGRICGTPHGNANAMVLPEVLSTYGDCVHGRLAELARRTGFSGPGDDATLAGRFIHRIMDLRQELDLPLLPRGLLQAHVHDIVRAADSEAGNLYPVPRYLAMSEISDIVRGLLPASQPQELEIPANGH